MGKKSKKMRYADRDDLTKIASQWKKLTRLHDRRDYSAAITRSSTAAEIAANFAIRREFAAKSDLTPDQVNAFLRDANGLNGKVRRLLLILRYDNDAKNSFYRQLLKKAVKINTYRNSIVHSGEFSNRNEAMTAIATAQDFIETLVGYYEQNYFIPGKIAVKEVVE